MNNRRVAKPKLPPAQAKRFVETLFQDDLHAKRVSSLAGATLGAIQAGAMGVHAIGRGLATAHGLIDKHAVKQVDRLFSNKGMRLEVLFPSWVQYVIGERTELVVNLDWTEFAKDDHSMLVLAGQTEHGRSVPLMWQTVQSSTLKGNQVDIEDDLLMRFVEAVGPKVQLTIVADRGFGDQSLYALLESLGCQFLIRFRQNILVENSKGEQRKAGEWLGTANRARVLRNAKITSMKSSVPTVVCAKDPGMKDAWCLASNIPKLTATRAKKMYGKRFSIEELFRDIKDLRFGMGMSWNRVRNTGRRDRMMLVAALAHGLLTLLGLAGEAIGFDRMLKTNTSKKRTISLFRQGVLWYERIPNMPPDRLSELMRSFGLLMLGNQPFAALSEVE